MAERKEGPFWLEIEWIKSINFEEKSQRYTAEGKPLIERDIFTS